MKDGHWRKEEGCLFASKKKYCFVEGVFSTSFLRAGFSGSGFEAFERITCEGIVKQNFLVREGSEKSSSWTNEKS